MKLSTFRTDQSAGIRAALAVLLCSGGLRAASLLTATPAKVALTCDTATGPGAPAAVLVKPVATLAGSASIVVLMAPVGGGLVATAPASQVLNAANQSQGLTYTISVAAGCSGAASGSAVIRFYAGGNADVSVPVNVSVTASASALAASPVTLTCVRNAGPPVSYTPGAAETVTVTSAALGGTPFTVDAPANPAWLAVTPVTGGLAGPTGISLTVSAVSPCGNYPSGSSNSVSIHLKNQPAPDALIPVTLRVLGPAPLIATPPSASMSYIKGSETPASADVALSSPGSPAVSFTVDTTSLPPWLAVDTATGNVPKSLHFTTTSVADANAQGTYTASVRVRVAGFADLVIPFSLTVSNPAPKLTVSEGLKRDLSWTVGQRLPIPYITLTSSGSAIPYTIVTGGPLAPIINASFLKGFAYSYGTPIPVAFDSNVFAAAQAGDVLTGTVTITSGTPSSKTVITINVKVLPVEAALLAITPRSLPTAAPGQTFTVALSGVGFVSSSDTVPGTFVGIVSGGSLVADANIVSHVVNASNLILTITVPAAADPYLPFSPTGAGGTVNLGVCNPSGAACTTPTGTVQLAIGGSPLIQAVTSSSSFIQVTPPTLPAMAPYDMVSLFGINFCTGSTGCGKGTLYGALDPVTLRYPSALSPDEPSSEQRRLTVTFQTRTTPPVLIANAPLLFATSTQINLLVPASVAPFIGKSVDIVVNFGTSGTVPSANAPFAVSIVAASPGIFTVGGDGQGEGAILDFAWDMITRGNEAGMRQNAADSDTVQIYVTGLGVPDGTADNATVGTGVWPVDCVSPASYLTALNFTTSSSSVTLDGALVSSGLFNAGRLAPCLKTTAGIPTVTVGGQPALVTYAGWVPDSVAGQYQLNVKLPGSGAKSYTSATGDVIAGPLTVPVQLPVVVTARGRASQAGVTMWVAPRLKVAGPAATALRGTVGTVWSAKGSAVTATGGSGPYQYAVTSGSLPSGLTLDASTEAIAGTPAVAGTFAITVTATDSAAIPLTGSATFVLTIE